MNQETKSFGWVFSFSKLQNQPDVEIFDPPMCSWFVRPGNQSPRLLRRGIQAQVTTQIADEIEAGLIVIGSQGKSAIREAVSGSTLKGVVRQARQPILVVWASKQENR